MLIQVDLTDSPSPLSPIALPPKSRALLTGISYSSCTEDSERGDRPSPLGGPVRDVGDMKRTLMEVYDYREEDIVVMTDEEENKGSRRWPSKENVLQAMVDLVANASPSDAFVFYYAGHCVKSDDDKHVYIVTCDDEKISGSDIRAHLVNSLPQGSRLTAIIDACFSGLLLDLEHYNCKCIIRRRCQSYSERKKPVKVVSPKRRHTHADQDWLMRNDPQLRAAFRRAAVKMLAVARWRLLVTKRNSVKKISNALIPRSRCGIFCKYERQNGPLVISLSACAHNERTWEDSKRKGKGMTVKLIKILRKNPSVQVGDLNEQLKRSLSKLAFKRVRKARRAFRELDETISLKRRKKLSTKYRDLLDYREQTAQIGSLYPLRLSDQFILHRGHIDPHH